MTQPPRRYGYATRREKLRRLAHRAALPLLLAGVCSGAPGDAAADDALHAWVTVTREGDLLRIQGMAEADAPLAARYRLRVLRIGPGGKTATTQGGLADLPGAGSAVVLSEVAVNVGEGTRYSVELTVTGPDGERAHAALSHPASTPL